MTQKFIRSPEKLINTAFQGFSLFQMMLSRKKLAKSKKYFLNLA